jgi:type IV secretory pathway VirB6-like protein
MSKIVMRSVYSFFLLTLILAARFSWADYQLLPEELLSSSQCGQSSAPNFCGTYSFNPNQDCSTNPTNVDATSCQEMQFYLVNSTVLADLGNPNTEGAYVSCNGGIDDFANCTQGGNSYFSIASNYSSATPNINNKAVPKSGGGSFGSVTYYCPLTRCDVNTDDIWFYVSNKNTGASVNLKVQNGQFTSFPITDIYSQFSFDPSAQYTFIVNQVGNNLCVFTNTDIGPMIAGCKPYVIPPPPAPSSPSSSSCFSTTACTANASTNSKAFWSVSGKIVECVQDVISAVFIGTNPSCASLSFLGGLQQGLRQAVLIALVLYVVLFGLKIVTSGEEVKKSEFFLFILKFALVLYFSVGIIGPGGQLQSGLSEYVYPGGVAAMTSFANFVMTAANTDGLCYYDPNTYASGYSYLAVWDALDCRVAYYLGLYLVNTSGPTSSVVYGILGVIIPALFSLEIIFFILLIVYGIFILSFAVYFVHFYIIALIMFAITVYIGVIVVPLALFSYTKGFFDEWLKSIISYVVQPVIVTAFMAFILMIFDIIIFGNCQFTQNQGAYPSWSTTWSECTDGSSVRCCNSSQLNPKQDPNLPPLQCSTITPCQNTFGYILLSKLESSVTSFSAIFVNLAVVNEDIIMSMPSIMEALLEVLLFIYLLSLFGEDLGNFASKLTSGPNIGQFAKTPSDTFKSIMNQLVGAAKGDVPKPPSKDDGSDVSTKSRDGIDVAQGK